jgi:hypothetical protein
MKPSYQKSPVSGICTGETLEITKMERQEKPKAKYDSSNK